MGRIIWVFCIKMCARLARKAAVVRPWAPLCPRALCITLTNTVAALASRATVSGWPTRAFKKKNRVENVCARGIEPGIATAPPLRQHQVGVYYVRREQLEVKRASFYTNSFSFPVFPVFSYPPFFLHSY